MLAGGRGEEGDHGSPGRVERADLQLSEAARGEVDREVAERTLAYTLRTPVETAYARGSMSETRGAAVVDWGLHDAGSDGG